MDYKKYYAPIKTAQPCHFCARILPKHQTSSGRTRGIFSPAGIPPTVSLSKAIKLPKQKRPAGVAGRPLYLEQAVVIAYFFLHLPLQQQLFSAITAWAAAIRAMGTRNGEQDT